VTLLSAPLYLGLCVEAGLIAGILYKALYRTCWAFLPYLALVWFGDSVEWLAPRLRTWDFYLAKESLVAALKVVLAMELYVRLFAGLPGARRLANIPLLASLLLTLGFLWGAEFKADPVKLYQTIIPIANDGTTLVLSTILGLATWFKVPAPPLHRAILRGFVAFLLVYTLSIHLFAAVGWQGRTFVSFVSGFSYDLLLIYWLFAVWRRRPGDPAPPAVMRRLRTWASSS
jgi:hypothetical protein